MKSTPTKSKTKKVSTSSKRSNDVKGAIKQKATTLRRLNKNFLNRRPHRSFRSTKRRDYVRSLKLPGYFAFTKQVFALLRLRYKTYLLLSALFSIITILLVGFSSQEVFLQLSETLRSTSGEIFTGGWGQVGQASLLFVSIISGNISGSQSETQQIYGLLLVIFTWLCTVWLLRAQLAGKKPRLRDGLYNSGAPFIPTLILFLLLLVQLLPGAIAAIGIGSAITSDILGNGFLPFLIAIIATLLSVLSLYFISSTFIALIIVTLPGMYPWQALRTAGDLVVGRRIRILYRLLWMLLVVAIIWLTVMIPLVALVSWLQSSVEQISFLPVIPIVLVLLTTTSIVFVSSYVYLLYRKVVDDDASPA